MLDLYIDKFSSDEENYEVYSGAVSQVTPSVHPADTAKLQTATAEVDIFDLARSIAGRAYSRRRLWRASSIF